MKVIVTYKMPDKDFDKVFKDHILQIKSVRKIDDFFEIDHSEGIDYYNFTDVVKLEVLTNG